MKIMKHLKYIGYFVVAAIFSLAATSCDDNMMEWEEQEPAEQITESEIPLDMEEKLERYEALNTYTNIPLGVGVGAQLYLDDEVVDSVIHQNFDEVVAGYAMKHGAMVGGDGTIDFTTADAFVDKAVDNGLKVYGHTLVWHQNQNASYLNGLIAPEIIPGTEGENLLDISGLEDGSFTDWQRNNTGDGIEVVDGEGVSGDDKAVRMIASESSSDYWSLQLQTPEIAVDSSHTHEISFFIRSDQPGAGRISFDGLENNYPYKDWYNTGGDYTESFETTSTYQQVKFTVDDFTGTSFSFFFDLGSVPGVTYYIDVSTINVVDLDAESEVVNYIPNGTFDENIDNWDVWNGPSDGVTQASEADAYEGAGALRVEHDTNGAQYEVQVHSDLTETLPAGDYTVSYYIRSEAEGSVRCSTTGTELYQGDQTTTTSWEKVEWEISPDGELTGLNFDLGAVAGTYYIDNVVVSENTSASSPSLKVAKASTSIEKTDEEKTQIISEAMEDWISQMVGQYKDDVHAWDVVNEPMKEDGTVRTGDVSDPADDEFYWQKYLGKDYAVMAFNLARQYGNEDDTLFINDYNLEHSIPKCEGIVDYVEYIENQGARVDGIGTQMHVNINTSKEDIETMFQLLAATGKLIKISELDVQVQNEDPSGEDFEQQAEMYRFIAEAYNEHIPEDQQYGITVWGVSDAAQEHENWLSDDAPCLWDADYQRKIAYKYFADGLAGRDVSEDFTGELQE